MLLEGRDTPKRGRPTRQNSLGVHALTCPGLLTGSLIQRPRSLRLAFLVRAGPGLRREDAVEGTTRRRVRVQAEVDRCRSLAGDNVLPGIFASGQRQAQREVTRAVSSTHPLSIAGIAEL